MKIFMVSTEKEKREKQKVSANQNKLDTKMCLTFSLRKCIPTLDSLVQKHVQKSEVEVKSTSETMKKTEIVQSEQLKYKSYQSLVK